MVRLKVNTIMRACQELLISIPYGAIKRNLLNTTVNDTFIFQFLMVRLKGRFFRITDYENFISIPYGAIKSHV